MASAATTTAVIKSAAAMPFVLERTNSGSTAVDSERCKVDPKTIKTDEEIEAIIAPDMARFFFNQSENEKMINDIEKRTENDVKLIEEFISEKLDGDEKRCIMAFEAFREQYERKRKEGLEGVLYNSKAVNEYVYDVSLPEFEAFHDEVVRSAWHAGELQFEQDRRSWDEDLNDSERKFIKYTLAFFAAADAIVNDNIMRNFMTETKLIEVNSIYIAQLFVESIHNQVYGRLLKTYVTDEKELNHLFNAVNEIGVIKNKALWANRWIGNAYASYAERLIAFACVEGIFFSGSFASIFWLKDRKLASGNQILPQLITSNEWISRDEANHTRFAVMLHRHLKPDQQAPVEVIHTIVRDATMLEIAFVKEALKVDLVNGMTSKRMSQYILYTADVLLSQLGVEKLYKVDNPFEFMSNIGLPMKSNFFEVKVTDYKKTGNINEKELLSSKTAVFAEIGSDEEDF